jgi:hypothetical protein
VTLDASPIGQLDLFLHARAELFANEICNALLARDILHASEALRQLQNEAPAHPHIQALRTLCAALPPTPRPTPDTRTVADRVRWLETQVETAARMALGSSAPLFMQPIWRELAEAVRDEPYHASTAGTFCAELYLRGDDPRSAQRAALGIANRALEPAALHWLAVAGFRSAGLRAARPPLFRLAWLAPQRVPTTLDAIADSPLLTDWNEFWTVCDWLDPNPEGGAWFPAWSLYQYPATWIPLKSLEPLPESTPARAFIALQHLLGLEPRGHSAALITARAVLRELAPEFFALYMAKRRSMDHHKTAP